MEIHNNIKSYAPIKNQNQVDLKELKEKFKDIAEKIKQENCKPQIYSRAAIKDDVTVNFDNNKSIAKKEVENQQQYPTPKEDCDKKARDAIHNYKALEAVGHLIVGFFEMIATILSTLR